MSTDNVTAPRQDSWYCPHFKNVDESTLQELFSKVAAVRSQNRELFDFTHRPIQVHANPRGENTEERIVSEESVYRQFSNDYGPNFTVVIEGEVGTGKSELCAYLAHELADEGRPILHVDKSDDLMSLLSERIPDFYQEQFGEELPGASNFRQLKDDLENNGQAVAAMAYSNALLNLSKNFDIRAAGKEDDIEEFVQGRLSLLVEEGEIAREIKFVTGQAYRQNEFLQVFEEEVESEEAVAQLNEHIWRAIRNQYETASLKDVLERIGEKFTDLRPVIIFEDFSITAMEAEKLRKYMEDDTSAGWDFVVAGTRDSTEVLHTRTAEDRFEFYRTNKRDSNSVLFLDEDSAVSFIRPYLGYFKSFDRSVTYERAETDGQLELSLNPAPIDSVCGQCGKCDESFRDLYPFNEAFIRRIYSGLSESEQSPREFVMTVFSSLEDYYKGFVPAPSSSDELGSLRTQISPAQEIYEEAEEFAKLARWYGVETAGGEEVEIAEQFVEAFGFDQVADSLSAVTIESGQYRVRLNSKGKGGKTGAGAGGSGGSGDPSPPPKTKAERLTEELVPNVQPWQDDPKNFTDISQYMRAGLERALYILTNDYHLYGDTGLRYNLSSQRAPFVFAGEQTAPESDQIVIDENEFRLAALQNLLEFGIYVVEEGATAADETLLANYWTQLTGYANRWCRHVRTTEIEGEGQIFKREGFDLGDLALACYSHVVLLDDPTTELSARAVQERFTEGATYNIDPTVNEELKDDLPSDEFRNLKSFMAYAEQYEMLVEQFYGVTEKQLDFARVRAALDDKPPYMTLDALGRAYISEVSKRVRFDSSNKLRDMADTAYDMKRIDEELIEIGADTAVFDTFSEELGSLSLAAIEDLTSTLSTYKNVDAEMLESLRKFTRLNQTDIDDAVEAAQMARNLPANPQDRRVQMVLINRWLAGSEILDRYNSIRLVGGTSGAGFAEEFKRVSPHYVE